MPLSKLVLLATASTSAVFATELYFIENVETVPGDIKLWKADTVTKNATELKVLDKSGTIDVVSGAAICGNNYLAAWDTFPSNYGVLQVDLSSSNYTHMFNEGDFLYHAVGCHPTDENKTLLVGSSPSADTSALFSLVSFDLQTKEQVKLGDFPDVRSSFFEGFDSTFRFDADGNTVMMTIGKKGLSSEPTQGFIYTMDTTSGLVTHNYTVKNHALYTVFDGLKRGISLEYSDEWRLGWCDIECRDKSCTAKVTATAQDLWDNGKPFAICSDNAWDVTRTTTKNKPLNERSISSGKGAVIFDLSDAGVKGQSGALAADCSSM